MRVRFGQFVLDSGTRQLVREGEAVHLSPKAFQLLEVLVERRPNAIAKAELAECLWPGMLVQEANLKNLVAEIRGTLRSEDEATVIRTVHRFGYAFSGTAFDASDSEPASSVAQLLSTLRAFDLLAGENLIGRNTDCSVMVISSGVSRHHARVLVSTEGCFLDDMGSKNGTWLNGTRISGSVQLEEGDRIVVGQVMLTFHRSDLSNTTAIGYPETP